MVGGPGDKGLKLGLLDTLRLAWADPDLRSRMSFIFLVFVVYALCINVPVPIGDLTPAQLSELIKDNQILGLMNMFGGGAFANASILTLGLGPYISASIIMQVLTMGNPAWKKELQEGGEYARRQQNRRTRILTIALCVVQGFVILRMLNDGLGLSLGAFDFGTIVAFWTAGAMGLLWLGEMVSERGIGNGVSLLIFAGIVISLPSILQQLFGGIGSTVSWTGLIIITILFLATTWFIVMFTTAQRRIPIQHMRRNFGGKMQGGKTSYLPISVNMAGVIPIIFAIALIYMPFTIAQAMPPESSLQNFFTTLGEFLSPNFSNWTLSNPTIMLRGLSGTVVYMAMIFFFTYFWNAMTYNVEDIANNLKRGGSYIPGIRPGKQTKDFLDNVVSKVTFVGALFLSIAALTQFVFPVFVPIQGLGQLGGTSLLIMVSVALETMRQIEASILIRQYES